MIADRERIALVLGQSGEERRSVERASPDELLNLLEESISIQTGDVSKIAIGFSGGLDSSVIAKIAKDAGTDMLAVTIGVGRPPEVEQAERAATEIGIPIAVRTFSEEEVEEWVDRVLWLIEEPNLMKVSVAIAVNWVTQIAFENGRNVVLLGQGSDELFGGYRRFATILGERGGRAAEEAILESIRKAHEVNFQRDEQAISGIRAELRLPFATRRITELALRTPVGMKVRSSSDDLRKWILREAAIKLGVPSSIALKHKKAIQHASGVEKTIRTIARRHRRTPSSYLEESFRRMKGRASA
jgi:asparagine synthase (glutamine-hydrolysing)